MLKRNFIVLFLLTTYSFVLVHNCIPHHHGEVSAHEHGHHHHHDSEHKHDNQSEDSNSGNEFIKIHLQLGHGSESHFNHYLSDVSVKAKQIVASIPFQSALQIIVISEEDPPPVHGDAIFLNSYLSHSFLLRAPPALS